MRKIRKQGYADPRDFLADVQGQQAARGQAPQKTHATKYEKRSSKTKQEWSLPSLWNKKTLLGIGFLMLLSAGALNVILPLLMDITFKAKTISIKDTETLKDVLYGGDPWLLICTDKGIPRYKKTGIKHLSRIAVPDAQVAYVACDEALPSGKTMLQRWELSPYSIGLFAANNNGITALSGTDMKDEETLSSFVKKRAALKVLKIQNNEQFQRHCSKRKARCAIISHSGDMKAELGNVYIPKAMKVARRVKVVYVDTSRFKVQLDSTSLQKLRTSKNQPEECGTDCYKTFCLVNTQNPETEKAYIGKIFNGNFKDTKFFESFLRDCQTATNESPDFAVLSRAPSINIRVKSATPKSSPPKSAPDPMEESYTKTASTQPSDADTGGDFNADSESEVSYKDVAEEIIL